LEKTAKLNEKMGEMKSAEVKDSEPEGVAQWSTYAE
jgi:Mn-containing catalase